MTAELLKRGNELRKEISDLEYTLETVRNYKDRKIDSSFNVGSVYRVAIPKEVTSKVEMLVEIEIASILAQKKKEFNELGKTEQMKG